MWHTYTAVDGENLSSLQPTVRKTVINKYHFFVISSMSLTAKSCVNATVTQSKCSL